MIAEKKVTVYYFVCDVCGRESARRSRKSLAETDAKMHAPNCGKHRMQHDSTGGFRGILGGWNVYCVCGAHYVTEDPSAPFKCPKEASVNV